MFQPLKVKSSGSSYHSENSTLKMFFVSKFFGVIGLRSGCRLIGLLHAAWAFINFIFNLSSFSSPNFAILVDYVLVPERVDTFGRMWFALSSLCFWMVHVLVDVLLVVGAQRCQPAIMAPFVFWASVGAIWYIIFFTVQLFGIRFAVQIGMLVVILVLAMIFNHWL